MSDKPKPPFDRAAKKALAEERSIEGAKAMSECKAEGEAERAKTAHLKALRLAKVAAEKEAEMSTATAAGVFIAVSLIVIAAAVLIVRSYLRS